MIKSWTFDESTRRAEHVTCEREILPRRPYPRGNASALENGAEMGRGSPPPGTDVQKHHRNSYKSINPFFPSMLFWLRLGLFDDVAFINKT